MPNRPCWVEIRAHFLEENYRFLQSLAEPHAELLAIVKADAYGHGLDHLRSGCGARRGSMAGRDERGRGRGRARAMPGGADSGDRGHLSRPGSGRGTAWADPRSLGTLATG